MPRRFPRSLVAGATTLALVAVAAIVWAGAGAEDADPFDTATDVTTTTTADDDDTETAGADDDAPSTTTSAPPTDGDGLDDDGLDRLPPATAEALAEPIRLEYEVLTNNGEVRRLVLAADLPRWTYRDEENWFWHDGERTRRCLVGVTCQDSVGAELPTFAYGFFGVELFDDDLRSRTIAGIRGECQAFEASGETLCVEPTSGLLLLSDPGPMSPGPFTSERLELQSVGTPTAADFTEPDERGT